MCCDVCGLLWVNIQVGCCPRCTEKIVLPFDAHMHTVGSPAHTHLQPFALYPQLFPYIRANVAAYLERNWDEPETQDDVQALLGLVCGWVWVACSKKRTCVLVRRDESQTRREAVDLSLF